MAKIVGPVPPFIGTRDNVTIYLMNGEYIARSKSSLTGKRVKKDPAFARTMEWAGRLKQGARIASFIYRQMPVEGRAYKQYREITGKTMSLLKEGFSQNDIITMLEAVYLPQQEKNIESIITSTKPAAGQENNGAYNGEHTVHLVNTRVCNGIHNSESPLHSADTMICDGIYNNESPVHLVDTMICDGVYKNESPIHLVDTMICDGVYKIESPVHLVDTMVCDGVYNNRYILYNQYSHCNQCNQPIQRDKKAEQISVKIQSYSPSCEQCMAYYVAALLLVGRPYAASGQVGITGLSSLKYADASPQGFNRITKAKPSFKSPISRNFKELSQ